MHIVTRNVNTAFKELVEYFQVGTKLSNILRKPSRNGSVMMIDEPVTVTYSHPRERVLFNSARDANPFFHVYEALWMLAGRNDVAPLAYYAKQMREYSDDGETLNGAYGYRWRGGNPNPHEDWKYDQLQVIINHLKADPNSRRAVLQMWNVEDDLLKIDDQYTKCSERGCKDGRWTNGPGLALIEGPNCPACKGTGKKLVMKASKDVCCNLSVMFSLREETRTTVRHLDMTVTNRSNDMIWGLLGANYVHFSFLQEYMAARLGCEIGKYHHFTNNLHVYDWNWKPEEWLDDKTKCYYSEAFPGVRTITPLMKDPKVFEEELQKIVTMYNGGAIDNPFYDFKEPFFRDVAQPMFDAFLEYKRKTALVGAHLERIKADDWRIAATAWIQRRVGK